jgi:hypothetical protein
VSGLSAFRFDARSMLAPCLLGGREHGTLCTAVRDDADGEHLGPGLWCLTGVFGGLGPPSGARSWSAGPGRDFPCAASADAEPVLPWGRWQEHRRLQAVHLRRRRTLQSPHSGLRPGRMPVPCVRVGACPPLRAVNNDPASGRGSAPTRTNAHQCCRADRDDEMRHLPSPCGGTRLTAGLSGESIGVMAPVS